MKSSIPAAWMPPSSQARRIIVHWTAGGPDPSDMDLAHYHILVRRSGSLVCGERSIADNDSTGDGTYAAHVRGLNTGAIGLALCGMVGAVERPFNPGPYPLTKPQWNSALIAAASLCRHYQIPPNKEHLLMHCEVAGFLGVDQRGKWDISVLTFDRGAYSNLTPGEELRKRVAMLLAGD